MGYPLPRDEVRKLQLSPTVNPKMAEQPQQRIGLVLTVWPKLCDFDRKQGIRERAVQFLSMRRLDHSGISGAIHNFPL
jgi:hypothetical protein